LPLETSQDTAPARSVAGLAQRKAAEAQRKGVAIRVAIRVGELPEGFAFSLAHAECLSEHQVSDPEVRRQFQCSPEPHDGFIITAGVVKKLAFLGVVDHRERIETQGGAWTNTDPVSAHTITFGTEPANLIPPSGNVTVDEDGARHATISSPTDSVNSGFIVAAPQDRIGLAQALLGVTRFRVTFKHPGTFNYICGLHDTLGMRGKVIVLPQDCKASGHMPRGAIKKAVIVPTGCWPTP
jgi:plastocyanin